MGILDSIFDFAASPKGLVSILAALASAKDRERARPATGGGVSYAMPGPRRLQAVKNLGRYTDVMGLANGGTADEEEAVKALLYGIAQGPYGPLLAYDIPELNLAPVPEPEKPRVTQPTAATINESSYEIPPPPEGQPVGTYNQQINDFLTNMVARAMTLSPTALVAKGIGTGLQYGLGKALNATVPLGEAPIESAVGMPTSITDMNEFAAQLSPEERNAVFGGDQYGGSYDPGTGDSSMGSPSDFGSGPSYDFSLSDAGGYMREGGEVRAYAQGGPVRMEDGGFVLTKRAVDGAGGPRGLAAALPQARMIRGPGTGTSDSIPATISGPRGQTPARVSNGEAYVPRRAVQAAGGPKRMYGLMSALERRA
jgi:hypothetical protein